jgi:TonB family protein
MRFVARQYARVQPASWAAAFGGAVLFNVLVLAWLTGFGHGFGSGGFGATKLGDEAELAAVDEPDLKTGCVGDALLAASARYTLCFGPWHDDTDACLDESFNDMWIDLSSCQARDNKNVAEVAMIEAKQAAKIKSIDPEPLLEELKQEEAAKPKTVPMQPAAPAPPPPPEPAAPPHRVQIVETVKPQNEAPPEHAEFVSEYDTSTKKQTVARGTAKEPMVAKSKPGELTPKEDPKDASVKEHTDRIAARDPKAPDVPGTLAMRTPGAQNPADVQQEQRTRGVNAGADGPATADGYMVHHGDGAIDQQKHERTEVPHGESGAGGGAPDAPNLKPTQEVLERVLGGGNVDHMDDVDSGEETALNSKRWVYASFFNRMKRQVAQNWDPATIWRRNDPTGQVYGFKTRVTEVRVSLSSTGSLEKIVIVNPSGVGDLDDEAIRAFHAAAPFPNPPKELAGRDNLITFGFSFFFEIGHASTAWHM